MSRAETLRMGRLARARETMSSTCRVERRSPPGFNPATGRYESSDVTVVYAGKCELAFVNAQRMTDIAEDERAVGSYRLALPWNAPTAHDVAATDVVVMVEGSDPRTFFVDSVRRSDTDTAVYLNLAEHEHG